MNEYYTDGSCEPNPGAGGFAVILNGEPVALGGENPSTNIRMEGQALLAAIKHGTEAGAEYKIYTDSEFWLNVLTKWAPVWEKNNWHKRGGIKNLELVRELYDLYKTAKPELKWTRGHVGTAGNESADAWANKARLGARM
ncbi:MAG: ribonuclease HI [Candidatus Nomurabacteria bacterium]|jgi:ribonuclease HI|nr:ribonuclease HI [Candidatus Nomurabacteria bacterium]